VTGLPNDESITVPSSQKNFGTHPRIQATEVYELPGDFGIFEADSAAIHELATSTTNAHPQPVPPPTAPFVPERTDIIIVTAKATVTLPRGRFKSVTLSYNSTCTENLVSEDFVLQNEIPSHQLPLNHFRVDMDSPTATSYVELELSLHPYNVKTSKVIFRVMQGIQSCELHVGSWFFENQRLGLIWKGACEAMTASTRMRKGIKDLSVDTERQWKSSLRLEDSKPPRHKHWEV
jgi:hypothetical protein